MKSGWPLIILLVVFCFVRKANAESAAVERNCFGLLWCTETSSDTYSADYFFYLYSVERTPTLYRFAIRPFYSQEKDRARASVRRSVLWPLSSYERDADSSWFHFFPLYWRRVTSYRDGSRFTLAIPLFYKARNDKEGSSRLYALPTFGSIREKDSRKTFLFPFWSNERHPDYRRTNALGLPTGYRLGEGPSLALFETIRSSEQTTNRFTPFFYQRSSTNGRSATNVLFLYQRTADPGERREFLFPLYGRRHGPGAHRETSAIGYRKLSLFWRETDEDGAQHHVFPLYSRVRSSVGSDSLGVIGYGPVSLFWIQRDKDSSSSRLFPIYEQEKSADDSTLSVFGVSDLALFHHVREPHHRLDRLFPLYERDVSADESSLAVMGVSALSLYRRQTSPDGWTDRLFPLYGRQQSKEQGRAITALGLPPLDDGPDIAFYSHRSSGSVVTDRFFPLYSYERDEAERELDVLLLYRHRRTAGHLTDMLLPLYRYRKDLKTGGRELSMVGVPPLTLFDATRDGGESHSRLFPLYSAASSTAGRRHSLNLLGLGSFSLYHRSGDPGGSAQRIFPLYGDRRWSGGSATSAFGFAPPRQGTAFALFERRTEGPRRTARFFPIAWSNVDTQSGDHHLNLLLVFDTARSSDSTRTRLFPVWSERHAEETSSISFLGFDDASLIHIGRSPSTRRTWFIPLFADVRNDEAGTGFTDVAILFFRYREPDGKGSGFFPIYSDSTKRHERTTGVLGLDPVLPVSLYRRHRTETRIRNTLFPIFDRNRDLTDQSVQTSVLGYGRLSLYRRETSTTTISDRLFPLYAYRADREADEQSFNFAVLYHHGADPDGVRDSFFPLWSYQRDTDPDRKDFGLIGYGPVSLYRHVTSSMTTSDAFFPLYRYSSDRALREKRVSVIWPLASYQSQNGRVKDANFLWWLFRYERLNEKSSEIRLLGGRAMAVYKRSRSPERIRMEFNPIVPMYDFERTGNTGQDTEWNFLGGFIGHQIKDGKSRMRLLWIWLGPSSPSKTKD